MSDPSNSIVTRFAPSPTGALHVGGARTALFNWAMARGAGGRFLLRIEDTDRTRSSETSEQSILDDLQWLGLDWDNAGSEPRQSQRLPLYHAAIDKLLAADRAYESEGAVFFRMLPGDITVIDAVFGQVTTPAEKNEDFVIRKSDGFPTYHFAVVVDDADMDVTHVIRGQEHLNNTPKHWALQEALGLAHPVYAHMSLTINPDGSKMSKRDKAKTARKAALVKIADHGEDAIIQTIMEYKGPPPPRFDEQTLRDFLNKKNDVLTVAHRIADVWHIELPEINVEDFRYSGYLPSVLCNFIALLGWNPGENRERFNLDFLASHFTTARLIKGNSSFDRQKLAAFNGDTLQKKLAPADFVEKLREFWLKYHPYELNQLGQTFDLIASAYQIRSKTLRDPHEQGAFFLCDDDQIVYDFASKGVKKVMLKNDGEGFTALNELSAKLAALEPWSGGAAHEMIKQLAEQQGVGMGKYAQPLRVAVSGSTVTPPIDATLDLLGKASTLARIQHCLASRVPSPKS